MSSASDPYTHKGDKLEGTYCDSRMSFDLETSPEWNKSAVKSASEFVEKILDRLEPHKHMLSGLTGSGSKVELIIAIYVESNTSAGFSPLFTSVLIGVRHILMGRPLST